MFTIKCGELEKYYYKYVKCNRFVNSRIARFIHKKTPTRSILERMGGKLISN